ncbi:MAG: hypothetical protein Q9227_002279 [Pyrenula ochraceoflavens]
MTRKREEHQQYLIRKREIEESGFSAQADNQPLNRIQIALTTEVADNLSTVKTTPPAPTEPVPHIRVLDLASDPTQSSPEDRPTAEILRHGTILQSMDDYHDIAQTWALKFPDLKPHLGLISHIASFVETFMSKPPFDSSHNFAHIRRVVSLAKYILNTEFARRDAGGAPDPLLVVLAALLHDVNDKKYKLTGSNSAGELFHQHKTNNCIVELIWMIVDNVSYSHEMKDPDSVRRIAQQRPELAIVQDADRLDALGAVGIARCFTFSGARDADMNNAIEHFSVKLLHLKSMMKTETGRKMARERTGRLKTFLGWWQYETAFEDRASLDILS